MLRTVIVAWLALWAGTAFGAELPPDLAATVARAEAEGLPAEAVQSKALEGLAKGVSEARIALVLDALVVDLGRAREALPDGSAEMWVGGARALRSGAKLEAIRGVVGGDVEVDARALHALADLLALGVAEADAVRVVRAAGSTPTAAADISVVATTAAALIGRGSSPTLAANQVLAGLIGQHAGAVSLPDGAPGKSNGNAYGHDKGGKGKAWGKDR